MRLKKIINLFKKGNVCVTGLKGSGKDLLFGNVIARRKEPYISNLNYGKAYYPLDLKKLSIGTNTFKNFIENNVKQYQFPYPLGADVYISDAGIYFPAQHFAYLNSQYDSFACYQALSRQVSNNSVHVNAQNLNRVWDKIREQSDKYIYCNWSIVIFGFVLQSVTLYEKYESCVNRVKPCRVRVPLFNKEAKTQARIHLDNFRNTHGMIKRCFLFYRNKSKHDTYYFQRLLIKGVEPIVYKDK